MLKKSIKFISLFLTLVFLGILPSNANPNFNSDTLLFGQHTLLKLTIKTDLRNLVEIRDRHMDYQDASISYLSNGPIPIEIPLEIKVRGNSRLKTTTCDFPPLRLKFKNRDITNSMFGDNKKLKLVTHCKDNSPDMLNGLYREYLAYRIYNIISLNSLDVRLVEITYIDINTTEEITQYGFLIEDGEHLSNRLAYDNLAALNLSMEQLDRNEMIKMSMFQYMIGNKDWSVPKLHNIILLREGTHVPPIAIPYDFDMSSFANPPYRSQIIGNKKEVFAYQGFRVSFEELESSIHYYQEQKEEILNLILDFPMLPVRAKQLCLQQIEKFYIKFENKNRIRKNFVRKAS